MKFSSQLYFIMNYNLQTFMSVLTYLRDCCIYMFSTCTLLCYEFTEMAIQYIQSGVSLCATITSGEHDCHVLNRQLVPQNTNEIGKKDSFHFYYQIS